MSVDKCYSYYYTTIIVNTTRQELEAKNHIERTTRLWAILRSHDRPNFQCSVAVDNLPVLFIVVSSSFDFSTVLSSSSEKARIVVDRVFIHTLKRAARFPNETVVDYMFFQNPLSLDDGRFIRSL